MNRNIKNYGLKFSKSILSWDEALPIGNGHLGALIYGDGPIKYAIDCLTLWDKRDSEASIDKDFTFKKLYECAMSGEEGWKRKKEIFEKNSNFPYPTKLSAGRIELDFGKKSDNVISTLDIVSAVANVSCGDFALQSFVSATQSVGLIRVFGKYSLNLHIPGYFSGDENGEWCKPSGLFYNTGEPEIIENGCLKYPRSYVKEENGYTFYVQKSLTDYAFAVVLYTKKCEGYDEIYYTVVSSDDADDFLAAAKAILSDAASIGYDVLLSEHKKWWHGYWTKSDIRIADKEMERAYYFNWYLFASTSRKGKSPMPLQGVWTADSDALPPWGGDYHHDTNTQMSYWGYAKANRLDEGRVFPDYLWNTREAYRRHAKRVYGVDGYLIPGCSTRDGRFMGTSVQYALSPTMTIWAAKAFDDYYRYTGDTLYLKNRAYPFMKRVADAITGLFVERDGKYYLPLSTSPEILEEDRAIESYHIGNTTFDQSLIIYLFETLLDYEKTLDKDTKKCEDILSRLDGLYISENKEIMLSEKMNLPYSHRHFSHMMCVYPLHILNYDTAENRKIIDNTLWEIERLGTGWWTGFSFPWCASLYAMAENGGAAYEKLRMFVKGFLSPNGFHLNGDYKQLGFSQWHYRPFTLEALYAYNDAVQEMLMQDHNGYVDLFPAVPDAWGDAVEFKNFNTLGKIGVSAKKHGEKIAVSFKTKKPATISLKNRFNSSRIKVTTKSGSSEIDISGIDVIAIPLSVGTTKIEEI